MNMGIALQLYRSRIGIHNTGRKLGKSENISNLQSFFCGVTVILLLSCLCILTLLLVQSQNCVNVAEHYICESYFGCSTYTSYSQRLLELSSDVELNPGPLSDNSQHSKFSKKFNIFSEECVATNQIEQYILFEDFLIYLRSADTNIPKYTVKRFFLKQCGGITSFNGKEAVLVRSVLQYCFIYSAKSNACLKVTNDIQVELVGNSIDNIKSSLNLYRRICKSKFHYSPAFDDDIQFTETDIYSLVTEHKIHFSESNWKKICWFEHHFSRYIHDIASDLNYEDVIELKYKKLNSLLSFKECARTLLDASRAHSRETLLRLATSKKENQVEILCSKRHLPSVIDNEILNYIQKQTIQEMPGLCVACFDTTASVINNSIWVVIGCYQETFTETDIDSLCKGLFFKIYKLHDTRIEKVHILNSEIVPLYFEENVISARFHLRDDLEEGTLHDKSYEWDGRKLFSFTEITSSYDKSMCKTCLDVFLLQPLTIETFNVIHEWYMSVPCEVQILLESFVNKTSIKRSKEPTQYFKHKLQRLYAAYESLINISNKKFLGLFQQSNANELLIEYKAVSSVFDVTSSAGTTGSLRNAEKKLNRDAKPDLCYYETYLKQHQFKYQAVNGQVKENLSLRDCHLILMLDNLVRLTHVSDPNPGEQRSKQICTLPITLQGLAVDHEMTSTWHSKDCDSSQICTCKTETTLSPQELQNTILLPVNEEKTVYDNFQKLMTWGNTELWSKLLEYNAGCNTKPFEGSQDLPAPSFEQDLQQFSETIVNEDDDEGEDEALFNLLNTAIFEQEEDHSSINDCSFSDEEGSISLLENSMEGMSILSENVQEPIYSHIQNLLTHFGLTKFKVPPLITRHPPPAYGRDDDMKKIQEILDDVLRKMGYLTKTSKQANRILCGADQKIGNCLLRIMSINKLYKVFLPEFPLLHLRKSNITILLSAYKDAGIIQMLQYMRDDNQDDWAKLVSIQHIDKATRYIRRIAISLRLAFLVKFSQHLDATEFEPFIHDMETLEANNLAENWNDRFASFLNFGKTQNATFNLHLDMMQHCENVIAIALSERLGGRSGYELLLSAVKRNLLFSFVNNASSYAPYCTQLLFHHYTAGHFHQNMKYTLFTTPFKGSSCNFACDTKREMDHLDAIKGFRSGSNTSTVSSRLSLIDSLTAGRKSRLHQTKTEEDFDKLGWEINDVDTNHIIPTTELILSRNALSTEYNDSPFNVYSKEAIVLPKHVLDDASLDVGKYLMLRYMAESPLFPITHQHVPQPSELNASLDLVRKATKSKSVTIKRIIKSTVKTLHGEKELEEQNRKKNVDKEMKIVDCLSSKNNTCQALVKPDSSKPKVLKSLGMQKALKGLVLSVLGQVNSIDNLQMYIQINKDYIPQCILTSIDVCTIEFAGMKFKAMNVKSGKEYLKLVENFINSFTKYSANLSTVILCEEKYSFTPDTFKASTRSQRNISKVLGINHLKSKSSFLNDMMWNKDIITKTDFGKSAVSTYLAENIDKINLSGNYDLIIDSELTVRCDCNHVDACLCQKYAIPLCIKERSFVDISVHQRKGEAEMAVVDWLVHFKNSIKSGKSLVCLVTSGDIDAVYIHLYAVNKFWPKVDGKFVCQVYVILQKPRSKYDIYNITAILELLQSHFLDERIGCKVALALCIGGNDFLPKSYQISHDIVLKTIIESKEIRNNLFNFEERVRLNLECFIELYKILFCPKRYKNSKFTYEQVRAVTIGKKKDENKRSGYALNDPRKWLPPESAVQRLGELVQLQIDYLSTAGTHDSNLPNFVESLCIQRNLDGEVFYDFGHMSSFQTISDLPDIDLPKQSKKRNIDDTPQRGSRRKFMLTSTPKKK